MPQKGILQDVCALFEGLEGLADIGVDGGLGIAVARAAVTGTPAGALPGLSLAGASGDVAAGSQLIADLTQASGIRDIPGIGGRAIANVFGGRVVTRALRGVGIGPYLDKAGQNGLNGMIGEFANMAASFADWLDPDYGC